MWRLFYCIGYILKIKLFKETQKLGATITVRFPCCSNCYTDDRNTLVLYNNPSFFGEHPLNCRHDQIEQDIFQSHFFHLNRAGRQFL